MIRTLAAAFSTTVCLAALAAPAMAQTRTINVPAGSLKSALDAYARASGREVIYKSDEVRRVVSAGTRGSLSVDAALGAVLAGTGFEARVDSSGAVAIVRTSSLGETDAGSAAAHHESADIIVTGSRIRGAPSASPVIEITQAQMRQAGQSNIGEAVRSLPENFPGGQNPGVQLGATVANQANYNVTGASTLNLRGVGPDATLTLLNGHRLAYDGVVQAVDVSTIPLAALDRVEIVTDGASAIYGSDAVAGVANIILKKDFEGITASARLGKATEGGDFQQQYDLTTGAKWANGGFILAYSFERDTSVDVSQRSYTSNLFSPYTLLPGQNSHSVIFSGHQAITTFASFSLDATFNHRTSDLQQTLDHVTTSDQGRSTTNFLITPTLSFDPGLNWQLSLSGTYGKDNGHFDSESYSQATGAVTSYSRYCDCNSTSSAEISAEGPLIRLPGGIARLAFGGGYRYSNFDQHFYSASSKKTDIVGDRHSEFAYAELALPLVSEEQQIPLVQKLTITAAGRYENYSDFGDLATPKLGVIYDPTPDLTLRGSWGKSFKAPTLYQQYQATILYIWPVSSIGGSGYPANATTLMLYGGNKGVKAERATTWTATLDLHPRALHNFQGHITYFDIRYRDRLIQPIGTIAATLSNPIYREFLDTSPTLAQQQAAFAAGDTIMNFSGKAYDASSVVAIAEDRYSNAAFQSIRGVDISSNYFFGFGNGRLSLSEQATWLESRQQSSSASPVFQLAGTVYNPPKFRARGGVAWTASNLNLSAFANYTGRLKNTILSTGGYVASSVTFDGSVSYSLQRGRGLLNGIDFTLAVINIADKKPPFMQNPAATYFVNYDSTNYSAVGRFINITVSKHW